MSRSRPASLYDLLTAWQAGEIGYRGALARTKLDTLGELYDAATLSGVTLNTELNNAEREQARLLAPLLRDQLKQAA